MANEAITINNDTWTLTGTIVNTATSRRAEGVQVAVLDFDRIGQDDTLGITSTDNEGVFTITFDKADFAEWIFDQKPDLYFIVTFNGRQLLNTRSNPLRDAISIRIG